MLPVTMFPGIEHDFGGGHKYVIPALSLNAFKQLRQRGVDLAALTLDDASIDTVIAACGSALRRNYPDLTDDKIGDFVALDNMGEAMACVLDVSGLKRRAIAAAAVDEGAQGKAQGATTSETSTGTP